MAEEKEYTLEIYVNDTARTIRSFIPITEELTELCREYWEVEDAYLELEGKLIELEEKLDSYSKFE